MHGLCIEQPFRQRGFDRLGRLLAPSVPIFCGENGGSPIDILRKKRVADPKSRFAVSTKSNGFPYLSMVHALRARKTNLLIKFHGVMRPVRGKLFALSLFDLFGFQVKGGKILVPTSSAVACDALVGVSAVFCPLSGHSDDLQTAFHIVGDGSEANLNACPYEFLAYL